MTRQRSSSGWLSFVIISGACTSSVDVTDAGVTSPAKSDVMARHGGVSTECRVDLDCGEAGPCVDPECDQGRCVRGRVPAGTACLGGRCYDGECVHSSPSPCNFDGTCDVGEDCITCPGDCGSASAWSEPVRFGQFDELSTDEGLTFTSDGSTVYFSSNRGTLDGSSDVWSATRIADGFFGPPAMVSELSTPGIDSWVFVSRDGLEIVITWKPGHNYPPNDLLLARRESAVEPFKAPEPIAEVNTLSSTETTGSFSDDALTLLFASDRPGGTGSFDIWFTSRYDRRSPFQPPQPLEEVNSIYGEGSPVLLHGGLELIFAQAKLDSKHDVWVARRPSPDARFGPPELVPELTSEIMDVFFPMPDGLTGILYQRSRVPGRPDPIKLPRDQELWFTSRSCPPR